jgi:hypothetical protein
MKFVQKLHDPKHLPLGRTGSSSTRPLMKYLSCRIVQTKLPRFRSLTAVRLGDGRHISFWHDKWMLNSTLATLSPLSTPMLSDLNTQLLLFGDISGHLRSEKNGCIGYAKHIRCIPDSTVRHVYVRGIQGCDRRGSIVQTQRTRLWTTRLAGHVVQPKVTRIPWIGSSSAHAKGFTSTLPPPARPTGARKRRRGIGTNAATARKVGLLIA